MEFCNLDSNDRYLDYCGSICCSQNHHIRMSSVFFPHGEMDMKSICNFCKECFNRKRFNELKC